MRFVRRNLLWFDLGNRQRLRGYASAKTINDVSVTLDVASLVVLSLHLFAFTANSFLERGITCYIRAVRGEIECCGTFLCQMILYLTYNL